MRDWQLTSAQFIDKHATGFIPDTAYRCYAPLDGLAWVGTRETFKNKIGELTLSSGELIEFRQEGVKNNYVKLDAEDEIVRNADGSAVYLSDEEMAARGLPICSTSIAAFNQDGLVIGLASDEWGADGIWVVEPYQRNGIGVQLLVRLRAQFKDRGTIGQATNAGRNMIAAYHRLIVKQAIHEGKPVPSDVLNDLSTAEKHALFISWVRDNYGHEGTLEFTEVTDRYLQSGEFPEAFNDHLMESSPSPSC